MGELLGEGTEVFNVLILSAALPTNDEATWKTTLRKGSRPGFSWKPSAASPPEA
jgi:hypothetical protein